MKSYIYILLIFVLHFSSQARIPEYIIQEPKFNNPPVHFQVHDERCQFSCCILNKVKENEILHQQLDRGYDVIAYDLFMDWRNPLSSEGTETIEDRTYAGINKITLSNTSKDLVYIVLDALSMEIDSVLFENRHINYDVSKSTLRIENPVESIEVPFTVEVYYRYIGTQNIGFYLYPKGQLAFTDQGGYQLFNPERIIYTMSQLNNARHWMPCYDVPGMKSRSAISVRAPKDYSVSSNGLLLNIEEHEDGSNTFHWRDTTVISTYLMVANASIYKEWSEWFRPSPTSDDTLEIKYYVWDVDYDGTQSDYNINALHGLRNTVRMLEFFSEMWGDYPFSKYGITSIHPFIYGGMEHISMVTVNRLWLRGTAEFGLAHEVAHHWLGNLVTCESWADLWIQEGGASWAEALWYEELYGGDFYDTYMYSHSARTRQSQITLHFPMYDVPAELIYDAGYILIYYKSATIFGKLQQLMGKDRFMEVLRNIFDDYRFKSINTEQFKEALKKYFPDSPISMDTFFDHWVYSEGFPVIRSDAHYWKIDDNKYGVSVKLDQVQNHPNSLEYYEMPFDIGFHKNDDIIHHEQVIMNQASQEFYFEIDFLPDWVQPDISRGLFTLDKSSLTTVNEANLVENELTIYPNPIRNNEILRIDLGQYIGEYNYAISDIFGNKLMEDYIYNSKGEIQLQDLPSGTYFINVKIQNKSFNSRFVVIK